MKSVFKTLAIVLTLAFSAVSCSSDDDNNNKPIQSRDVKYEITGNFSGELSAIYFDKGGNPLNEDVTSLPWTKQITADAGVPGITFSASGHGGVKDQTLTAKIYVGGEVVKESTAKANNDGIIVVTLAPYLFP
ncbi:MmpS family membrane protein [Flavobacterium sp. 9]|uniref:MmpS family transport accessory protein n=1 Tax=Flavobacterium sp. 9 TaxID=2035198 RepID=UPI000C1818E8|nr:MmpS family transport accessory protein [Flavobacterium sp. 9]PIF31643.1 MmpS family membrane protein [Flavobacterium sp. 9]